MEELLKECKPFLTLEETANLLGVWVPTVRKFIKNNELGAFQMNDTLIRIPKSELAKFIIKMSISDFER